jgi:hypothetical protein
MATATNWFLTAGTLRSAFVEKDREPAAADSRLAPTFWACRDGVEIGLDLKDFIRELHDGELPNDWRYETIVRILDQILEISAYNPSVEWADQPQTIADALVCIYTPELAAWFAENASRCCYHDEWNDDCCIPASTSLMDRMQIAQHQCIESMVQRVLYKLELI